MTRWLRTALIVGVASALPALAQTKQFITPEQTTFINFVRINPYDIAEHLAGDGSFSVRDDLVLPDDDQSAQFPPIRALHRLEAPGQYLFVIADSWMNMDPLNRIATGADIIRVDGEDSYSYFYCGASVADGPAPATAFPIDAAYLEGGDDGDLVVSFESSGALVDGNSVRQADLVRFTRPANGSTGCGDWEFAGFVFESETRVGVGDATESDLVGAAKVDGGIVMSFELPTTLEGNTTSLSVEPGNLVLWDEQEFTNFAILTGWQTAPPLSSLSLPPDTCSHLGTSKADEVTTCGETWTTDLMQRRNRIDWLPADNAASYNVYTAHISNLDTLSPECKAQGLTDTQFPLTEVPPPGDGLYILISVVLGTGEELPYGQGSNGADRANPLPCSTNPPALSRMASK